MYAGYRDKRMPYLGSALSGLLTNLQHIFHNVDIGNRFTLAKRANQVILVLLQKSAFFRHK